MARGYYHSFTFSLAVLLGSSKRSSTARGYWDSAWGRCGTLFSLLCFLGNSSDNCWIGLVGIGNAWLRRKPFRLYYILWKKPILKVCPSKWTIGENKRGSACARGRVMSKWNAKSKLLQVVKMENDRSLFGCVWERDNPSHISFDKHHEDLPCLHRNWKLLLQFHKVPQFPHLNRRNNSLFYFYMRKKNIFLKTKDEFVSRGLARRWRGKKWLKQKTSIRLIHGSLTTPSIDLHWWDPQPT